MEDKKKLGGAGRLNGKVINKLQNYYGLAIRQNTDSLPKMRKAVGAVLYHCSEASSAETRHMFCGVDSQRCKFRMAGKKAKLMLTNRANLWQCEMKLCPYFRNFHPKYYSKNVTMDEPTTIMKPSMVLYGNAYRRTFLLDGIPYKLEYHQQYLILIRVLMVLMFLKILACLPGFLLKNFVHNVTL